ncbi:hypothetical protein [Pseudomonas sp. dw_358]|uniref:hypothetical protein n=1 Tax=Pseudomonas sp. dw_358 TaxID=2720083 RepID=UPI001BD6D971|nr:hypothetical protein [Pseudomonas sp. dw_358]
MRSVVIVMVLMAAGCNSGSDESSSNNNEARVNPFNDVQPDLAFSCQYEKIPAPAAEADLLFQYARWLQKNNVLIPDISVDAEIERLYRIATNHQHYKANINLQLGGMRGRLKLRVLSRGGCLRS